MLQTVFGVVFLVVAFIMLADAVGIGMNTGPNVNRDSALMAIAGSIALLATALMVREKR